MTQSTQEPGSPDSECSSAPYERWESSSATYERCDLGDFSNQNFSHPVKIPTLQNLGKIMPVPDPQLILIMCFLLPLLEISITHITSRGQKHKILCSRVNYFSSVMKPFPLKWVIQVHKLPLPQLLAFFDTKPHSPEPSLNQVWGTAFLGEFSPDVHDAHVSSIRSGLFEFEEKL